MRPHAATNRLCGLYSVLSGTTASIPFARHRAKFASFQYLIDIIIYLRYNTTKDAEIIKGADFMPTRLTIENVIKSLLVRYNAEYALLFGSYARGEETPDSDIDVVVFGGKDFKKSNIFAFAEDLREALGKNADVFEISEVNRDTPFYDNLMKEGVKIA